MDACACILVLGLAHIENLDPERLVQACAEDGRAEFLFTATPPDRPWKTGSAVTSVMRRPSR